MSDSTEEIRGRERSLISAILNADLAGLEELVAPSFVYTASELGRRTRQEWLDAVPKYHLAMLEILDMSIEPLGDVAIVHARISQDAMIHDHHRHGGFLITDVWVKRDGTWQILARTSVADKG
jgi:hypothetical protein